MFQNRKPAKAGMIFWVLWVLLFALYYPAAKAGFVTDFTGWLDQVKNHGFWENINRTNFHARSLYQFTQFATYIFYKLFGINPWLWHLLFITLHAINATLLFVFCNRLLDDSGVANGRTLSFAAVVLFCVSPYMSEVIVWEPSFHFLQGLLFILLILTRVQQFIYTGKKKYAAWAALFYLLSIFTLEIFYITPWLVLALAIFYRFTPSFNKGLLGKILLYFFLPSIILFLVRLLLFRLFYGDWVSRIGTDAVTGMQVSVLGKPAKYIFHLLFLGRFLSNGIKDRVYEFCDSVKGIVLFYSVIGLCGVYIIARFRTMSGKGRVASLLFVYSLITLALLIPLWFGNLLLVIFDRYNYFTAAFFYSWFVVMISFITIKYVRLGIFALYALLNLRFAIKVSRYWGKSARINHELLTHLPDPGNKTIILLNLPESMNGIPMIGSDKESEYKFMHNLLLPDKQINNTVYDVLSYNLTTPEDGAHITVANDSTLHVTLNQWGTWWWFAGKGGYSYENADYKLNLIDLGHWYELTLKKPSQNYLLLYETGGKWKVVDMSKRNEDQY